MPSSLLRREDDYRAFTLLPILMRMLRREQCDDLMKMAILSPYLDRENELQNLVCVSLIYSIICIVFAYLLILIFVFFFIDFQLNVLEALEYCILYFIFKYSTCDGR